MRETLDSWFPTALKWTGLVGTVLLALLWAVSAGLTDEPISPPPMLLAAFGTMAGIGVGGEAARDLGGRK